MTARSCTVHSRPSGCASHLTPSNSQLWIEALLPCNLSNNGKPMTSAPHTPAGSLQMMRHDVS